MLAPVLAALAGYAPPGLLAGLVEQKEREVAQLRKLPEAREDGPWALRLAYPAATSSYKLAGALGWRSERAVVIADLKRRSPGERLGDTVLVDDDMTPVAAVERVATLGATAAMVAVDTPSYGGAWSDLSLASAHLQSTSPRDGGGLPLICKDLVVDPIQVP